mgnify:CR=1 FL=1
MPVIEILGSGRIDDRDSAFPSTVQLPNGDILCSFSVGDGPNVGGGTDIALTPAPAAGFSGAPALAITDRFCAAGHGGRAVDRRHGHPHIRFYLDFG